ncbi:MAG: hypothetical protein IT193_13575, partial [Propionibacteriaceae bacterium]|nr:hypothetical protein [Propionibacteriaceae bacterium]
GVPNLVSVEGWARVPQAEECLGRVPTGGACLSVQAGRATATRFIEAGQQMVIGEVSFVDNGSQVPDGGTVLIEVQGKESTWTVTAQVANSHFRSELQHREEGELRWVIAHYLGGFGASPSGSGRLEL